MTADSFDELCLFWLPLVRPRARSAFERTFLEDMARRSRWRNWRPTPKQEALLRRLVAELRSAPPVLVEAG